MPFVHRPECTQLRKAVERGDSLVHVGGGPGIGKSKILEWLTDTLGEDYDTRLLRLYATHDTESLIEDIRNELYKSLPLQQRLKYRMSDVSGLWISSIGIEFETASDGIKDLKELTNLLPEDKTVVICIDDVHKLGENEQEVQESITWLADSLPANVRVVSAGRILFNQRNDKTVIKMDPLSEERSKELLRATVGFDEETARRLYDRIGGYPYYFALLSESGQQIAADGGISGMPEEELRRYIEQNYLDSLDADEERFLRQTVPLVELDERLCSLVVSEASKTDARRILSALRDRCIVTETRYDDQSIKKYQLHDSFREFLCELERTDRTIERLFEQFSGASVEDRRQITEALAEISADDPSYLERFIDQAIHPLHDDDGQVRRNASIVVARIAAEYPERVDSAALSTAMSFLESDDTRLRQVAGRQLADLAKKDPRVLGPHIDQFQTIIGKQEDGFPPHTPTIVARLAQEYPEQMRLVALQMKQRMEESGQTLLLEDIDSLGELNDQYDDIEFDPASLPSDYRASDSGISSAEAGQTSHTTTEQERGTDDIHTSNVDFPEDTDITFTSEFKQLDHSQYSEVLKVECRTDQGTRPAVLKRLFVNKEGFTGQFDSEMSLWSQIDDHENIVSLLDTGDRPDRWLLMEYLGGGSLADRLDSGMTTANSGFDANVAERVLDGICSAISHAHEYGIVHGDLTPSNILFANDNEWSPRVSDWGQARQMTGVSEATMIYSAAAPTVEDVTLPYAAPEMVDPEAFGKVDRRSDIYQIALIAYELYTGRRPFTATSPAVLMQQHLN